MRKHSWRLAVLLVFNLVVLGVSSSIMGALADHEPDPDEIVGEALTATFEAIPADFAVEVSCSLGSYCETESWSTATATSEGVLDSEATQTSEAEATGELPSGSVEASAPSARGKLSGETALCGQTEMSWEELVPEGEAGDLTEQLVPEASCELSGDGSLLQISGLSDVREGHPRAPEAAVKAWISDTNGPGGIVFLSCSAKAKNLASCLNSGVVEVPAFTTLYCHVDGRGTGHFGCGRSNLDLAISNNSGQANAEGSYSTTTVTASLDTDSSACVPDQAGNCISGSSETDLVASSVGSVECSGDTTDDKISLDESSLGDPSASLSPNEPLAEGSCEGSAQFEGSGSSSLPTDLIPSTDTG